MSEVKEGIEALRREIKILADGLWALRFNSVRQSPPGEAVANLMLAYRHLEDASMRLGKAMQALDGCASVYDRTQVPGA